jgi:hypothetical protein
MAPHTVSLLYDVTPSFTVVLKIPFANTLSSRSDFGVLSWGNWRLFPLMLLLPILQDAASLGMERRLQLCFCYLVYIHYDTYY